MDGDERLGEDSDSVDKRFGAVEEREVVDDLRNKEKVVIGCSSIQCHYICQESVDQENQESTLIFICSCLEC